MYSPSGEYDMELKDLQSCSITTEIWKKRELFTAYQCAVIRKLIAMYV